MPQKLPQPRPHAACSPAPATGRRKTRCVPRWTSRGARRFFCAPPSPASAAPPPSGPSSSPAPAPAAWLHCHAGRALGISASTRILGKTTRDPVMNKKRWKRRRTSTQDSSTDLSLPVPLPLRPPLIPPRLTSLRPRIIVRGYIFNKSITALQGAAARRRGVLRRWVRLPALLARQEGQQGTISTTTILGPFLAPPQTRTRQPAC